ncbi:MAG: hypothetical protein LUE17_03750 [Planctomycetaceae bacterium]|nr:hypothetical protein [Planctomycetaceae bacterium]
MAKAVRYQVRRSDWQPPQGDMAPEMENPEGKARVVASRAARAAARKVDPRVRKSAGKRVEEKVVSRAKRTDIETPEDMAKLVRRAKVAVKSEKTRRLGERPRP